MKGPPKVTGVGGRRVDQEGREAKRQFLSQALDEYYPDVDHDAGSAPAIHGEAAYCPGCHAIYRPKQWFLDEATYQRLAADPSVERLQCPSCKMIAREDFRGEVHLDLSGLETHRDQIMQTMLNEEARARQKNPHSRIGRIVGRQGGLDVATLNPALAHRIGVALRKAFRGTELESDYLDGVRFARVYWGRHGKPGA